MQNLIRHGAPIFKAAVGIGGGTIEHEVMGAGERRMDTLCRSDEKVHHVELQTKGDEDMRLRMFEYAGDLLRIGIDGGRALDTQLSPGGIRQTVINFTRAGQRPLRQENGFKGHLDELDERGRHRAWVGFRYEEINAAKLKGQNLLDSADPADVVLSVFCDDLRSIELVDQVIDKLCSIVSDRGELAKYLRAFGIFCDLHDISDYAKERLPKMAFEFEIDKDSMFYPVFEDAVTRAEARGRNEGEAYGRGVVLRLLIDLITSHAPDADTAAIEEQNSRLSLGELEAVFRETSRKYAHEDAPDAPNF